MTKPELQAALTAIIAHEGSATKAAQKLKTTYRTVRRWQIGEFVPRSALIVERIEQLAKRGATR